MDASLNNAGGIHFDLLLLQRVCKIGAEAVNCDIGIRLVGGNTRKIIGTHLCASLDNCLQILLAAQIAAYKISHAHTDSDGAVSVAELAVIIHLKSCAPFPLSGRPCRQKGHGYSAGQGRRSYPEYNGAPSYHRNAWRWKAGWHICRLNQLRSP